MRLVKDRNGLTMRIGFLEFHLSRRGGNAFCCFKDCGHGFIVDTVRHMRGYYIQVGKWGGNIWWGSTTCYEPKELGY